MSDLRYVVIPAPAVFDKALNSNQFKTLIVLCYFGAVKQEGCWPAYNSLIEKTGFSRRAIISHIKHLCKAGYVQKQSRARENGSQSSNIYRVDLGLEIDLEGGADSRNEGVNYDAKTLPISTPGVQVEQHPLDMNNNQFNDKSINNKKNTKKENGLTLVQWEEKIGAELKVDMMRKWIREKRLDEKMIPPLIEDFRARMQARGNLYVDFVAAFQVWLRSGYLLKTMKEITLSETGSTVVIARGLSL